MHMSIYETKPELIEECNTKHKKIKITSETLTTWSRTRKECDREKRNEMLLIDLTNENEEGFPPLDLTHLSGLYFKSAQPVTKENISNTNFGIDILRYIIIYRV